MTTQNLLQQLANNPSCADDYDPNAMSVAQARQYIRQFLSPVLETETVAIKHALGRILSHAIISEMNVPGHDNSAMDGFAFRHAEASQPLKVVGTALAGNPYLAPLPAGGCIKIMTGAMVPADVDTIVMQEHTRTEDAHIHLLKTPPQGANIRLTGEDIAIGQTVLAAGHQIQPADMGLLASLGVAEVQVFRRLKVAYFSTGDELVGLGTPLQKGQIYDSNRYSLWGMCQALGWRSRTWAMLVMIPRHWKPYYVRPLLPTMW